MSSSNSNSKDNHGLKGGKNKLEKGNCDVVFSCTIAYVCIPSFGDYKALQTYVLSNLSCTSNLIRHIRFALHYLDL